MTTTFNQQDGKAVLQLLGDIDVAGSMELKAMLSQAFSTGEDIRLDFSTAESLDIAAIQLLWAAARQAEKTGRVFHAGGPLPEGIQSDVRNAGFDDFPVSLETQLRVSHETAGAGISQG